MLQVSTGSRAGQIQALDLIYKRYSKKIFQYFYYTLNKDTVQAEDLTHDLFLKIFHKRDQYQISKPFKPWLFQIAANICKNEFRKIKIHNRFIQLNKDNIEAFGQLEPVLLYKGKIVDGRHRYWVLKELGIPTIKVKIISSKHTLEQVREIVFSSEVRRHQSPTQKAIQAFIYIEKHGITYREAEVKFAVSKKMISTAKFVSEHKGKKILMDLYHGKKVSLGTRTTDSLSVYRKLIENEMEALRVATLTIKPMAMTDIIYAAKPYIDAFKNEHTDVLKHLSKIAYNMAENR